LFFWTPGSPASIWDRIAASVSAVSGPLD